MTENEPPHCNHFVSRKKRYCRMTVRPGEQFCGEHQPARGANDTESDKIRIVCPLDPKHTCYAHNLRKHLKICNARPGLALPYIQKGVNSGATFDSHKLLSEFSTNEITAVIAKINKIYKEILPDLPKNLARYKIVEDEMSKPEYGDKSKKHLIQASAILGLLDQNGLIQPNNCFIEFGAGRGQLSYWLAQASPDSTFLLIERSSPKHKRDNKLDKTADKVIRIRADIADLLLGEVPQVSKTRAIVGVTKHLCGDATDLALRCLTNTPESIKVEGCVMTFCCHHRCRWGAYTGQEFFNNVGLEKNDFEMMCGMSSWATCGTGFSREKNCVLSDFGCNDRDREIGVNRVQKEELGRKAKMIINWGRLKFLQTLKYDCRLFYYVETDVSLENVCLVAKK